MRKLYEIEEDLLKCVDLETGEIIDEEKLKALEMERDKKIEGVILWRKDIMAEAEAIGNEIRNLSARKKVLDRQAESLKGFTEYALAGEKFKTARCSVSYRKSASIVFDDINKVPKAYMKELKDEWFSKTLIKEAIERGETVDGSHLEEKMNIQIR